MLRLRSARLLLLSRAALRSRAFFADAQGRGDEARPRPMTYNFRGVEPDLKAACLSESSKEAIWRMYQDNPLSSTVDRLASRFKISKQRVCAILWLKEGEKKQEAAKGGPLDDEIDKAFAEIHGSFDVADGDGLAGAAGEDFTEGGEESVTVSREEQMILLEFEQRMEFNKKKMSGVIQTKILSRRRPAEGWSYVVEELGADGKRGLRGGRRFVSQPDGTHRGLNELEKDFLRRETLRARRRLTPR